MSCVYLELKRTRHYSSLKFSRFSQRLAPPYFKTLITINTFKAGHSAFRCPAYRAAESKTFPLQTLNKLTTTASPCALAGQTAEHSFVLDFFVTFFVQACPPQAEKKVRKENKQRSQNLHPCSPSNSTKQPLSCLWQIRYASCRCNR